MGNLKKVEMGKNLTYDMVVARCKTDNLSLIKN